MNRSSITTNLNTVGTIAVSGGSRAATSLNTAYSHGVSGNAVAIRWMARTTDTIDALYIFLDNNIGTLGSITMACDIYNENTGTRAGTTLRDSSTATTMPGAVDKWIKFTFGTPYTPAVGEILWFVCYNTSGAPATNAPLILTGTNAVVGGSVSSLGVNVAVPYTTTSGFSTNGSAAVEMPFVIVQGSNYTAQPFTQQSATYYTNNTLERGIVITPSEDITVNGVLVNTAVSAYNAVNLYASATAPGGSAIATWDLDSDSNQTTGDVCGGKTFSAVTLTGGSTYRVAMSYGSSSQSPLVLQIEDYASYSSVFDAVRDTDTLQCPAGCIDNGAGGWTADKAICPGIALVVTDNPAQAAGGGQRVFGS